MIPEAAIKMIVSALGIDFSFVQKTAEEMHRMANKIIEQQNEILMLQRQILEVINHERNTGIPLRSIPRFDGTGVQAADRD